MFSHERKSDILDRISQDGKVLVGDLAEIYKVSEATVRRDIRELEEKGLLTRTFGGAVPLDYKRFEPSFKENAERYLEEKKSIGRYAASLIQDEDTILLDAGTTTLELAKNLKAKNTTVLTNSIDILLELGMREDTEVFIIGGSFRRNTRALVSPSSADFLKNFRVDKAFMGANCISLKNGFTTPNQTEAITKKAMIDISSNVYVLCDHSKFNKTTFSRICALDQIDAIITDENIEKNILLQYKEADVEILISK
ncbi:MAG: DeoR/GlpR family DNA-binding transcription regulator [Bacillota bacterium]|nr:DeoR/GlpR family DNA-binding transcription regulator [Bacillota bacterium]